LWWRCAQLAQAAGERICGCGRITGRCAAQQADEAS
jgi:hypothetical protein